MPLKTCLLLSECLSVSKWFIWTCLFLQSNNDILLPAMTLRIPPLLTLNNDSAESVQREALNHFKASTFTSYTELRPEDSMILLVLRRNEKTAGKKIKGQNVVVFFDFEAFPKKSWCDTAKSRSAHIISVLTPSLLLSHSLYWFT